MTSMFYLGIQRGGEVAGSCVAHFNTFCTRTLHPEQQAVSFQLHDYSPYTDSTRKGLNTSPSLAVIILRNEPEWNETVLSHYFMEWPTILLAQLV